MSDVSFTQAELVVLADFVCGRVDALKDMTDNMPRLPENDRKAIRKDIKSIEVLDGKLRPYYRKST